MNLPGALEVRCTEVLGSPIRKASFVGGGDISEARLLESDVGLFFLKYCPGTGAARLFEAEARGLNLLRNAKAIRIPQVLAFGETDAFEFLLLEYVKPGLTSETFWEQFGRELAALHQYSAPQFGLDHDNFIGSLPQSNAFCSQWTDFYRDQRLEPQLKPALQNGLLNKRDAAAMEKLYPLLPELIPTEPPALIHGDLWSGNYLVDSGGAPVLIDPAVSFGNREMDLAMSRLFGGFDWRFYRSYEEALPLPPGLEERIPLYQLYYLLVHVNLFGSSYTHSVRSILEPFYTG